MPDLYTFGEAMALFLASDTDSVLTARTYTRSTAGAEGNVAVGVTRLGLSAHFFTLMGNDQLGSAVLADFAAEGVDVSGVKRVDSFSSAMIRNPGTTAPVEASYLRKGAAASLMTPADLDQQVIAQSRWLHATGITCAISTNAAETVSAGLESARKHGIKKSFDLIFAANCGVNKRRALSLNRLLGMLICSSVAKMNIAQSLELAMDKKRFASPLLEIIQ